MTPIRLRITLLTKSPDPPSSTGFASFCSLKPFQKKTGIKTNPFNCQVSRNHKEAGKFKPFDFKTGRNYEETGGSLRKPAKQSFITSYVEDHLRSPMMLQVTQ